VEKDVNSEVTSTNSNKGGDTGVTNGSSLE
jgi:hypothetical protein